MKTFARCLLPSLALWVVACSSSEQSPSNEPMFPGADSSIGDIRGDGAHDDVTAFDFGPQSQEAAVDSGPCVTADGAPCFVGDPDAGPVCGDGKIDPSIGETCDDGNPLPGDGCSGICVLEPNSECPVPGQPCRSTIKCGDGIRQPGEGCDDGNAAIGDGCNATCAVDPGWYCPEPGKPCKPLVSCGDGRLQSGEQCDDGNLALSDGCTDKCRVDEGYRCPRPSKPCERVPVCGNQLVEAGEQCDDNNTVAGDGCSPTCRIEGPWIECPKAGGPCISKVVCGDGKLEGLEVCDDHNVAPGDGCSADCKTVETGFLCRRADRPCTPICGDGVLVGHEQCEDGNALGGDGCSSTCLLEPGYSCGNRRCDPGQKPTRSVCGNGVQEVGESCDKGVQNGLFYGDGTGCSKTCTNEPTCRDASGANRACSVACGDGNVDSGEDCDDSNGLNGDGCSSTCKFEPGFTCTKETVPDDEPCPSDPTKRCLVLPVVFRDFKSVKEVGGHPDFFYMGATSGNQTIYCVPDSGGPRGGDSTARCLDLVRPTLASGKPVFNDTRTGGNTCECQYTEWSENDPNHVPGYVPLLRPLMGRDARVRDQAGKLVFNGRVPVIQSATSFAEWYSDGANRVTTSGQLELQALGDGRYRFSSGAHVINTGFFPVDASLTEPKVCNLWPYWYFDGRPCNGQQYLTPPTVPNAGWTQATGIPHNFWFTTEARYLFVYKGEATLQFYGDDDLWIFINGRLAVDLGGIHQRLPGRVTLHATNGTGTVVHGGVFDELTNTITTPDVSGVSIDFGLALGSTYEIAVFHADRHPRESNYQLTLAGFSTERSRCRPECGDGRVTIGEECDNGTAQNAPNAYDGCTPECKFGPFCGDGITNGTEECDDGHNVTVYGGTANDCAPGCKHPSRCGDGVVDFGEQCDLGAANADGLYGGCSTTCKENEKCGDGVRNGTEQCDDGVNTGGYGQCGPGCKLDQFCGDGVVQQPEGEICDDGVDNGKPGKCTATCGAAGVCGDGIVQSELGETCDDAKNNGSYGGCTIDCQRGPRCGDGVRQDPEQCDYGDLNNDAVYGGCTKQCRIGPHCGDGFRQPENEECDDGNRVPHDGCSPSCQQEVILR